MVVSYQIGRIIGPAENLVKIPEGVQEYYYCGTPTEKCNVRCTSQKQPNWVLEVVWIHLSVYLSVIKCNVDILLSLSEVYLKVYNLYYTPPQCRSS